MIPTSEHIFRTIYNTPEHANKHHPLTTQVVMGVYPAYNDSLVVLTHIVDSQGNAHRSILNHILTDGRNHVIKQISTVINSNQIILTRDDTEIVLCQHQSSYFLVVQLQNKYKMVNIKLNIKNQQLWLKDECLHSTFVLQQTQVVAICIFETGYEGIYFYDYEAFKRRYGPLSVWKGSCSKFTNKVKYSNKLGWLVNQEDYFFRRSDKLHFEFVSFDRKTSSTIYESLETENSLLDCFNIQSIYLHNPIIHQLTDNHLVVHAMIVSDQISIAGVNDCLPFYQNCFEIALDSDCKTGIIEHTYRISFISPFECFSSIAIGNWIIYKIQKLQQMIQNVENENGAFKTCYVNLHDNKLITIFEESWKEGQGYSISFSKYCQIVTVNTVKENEREESQIKMTTFNTIKDVYFDFLMHLNQNFDDNLLEEAMNLLDA